MGRILALTITVLIFAACDTAPQSSGQTSVDCLTVPEAVRAKIESALTVHGGGTIPRAAAARSPDHQQWYYIAAEIDGPGLEGPGHVGVWSSNRLSEDGSGLMYSVGQVANEFSEWGDGAGTRAQLRYQDAGARAARQCL